MSVEDKVNWVYSSKTNQELSERYSSWANEYDRDLNDAFGYVAPQKAVDKLTQYLSKKARILDAGVGTGLVGELLHQKGYYNLEGIDISIGMLEQAAKKNVYTALHQEVMGEPLNFETGSFDGVVSVGVLTYGHAPSSSFNELIRITKSGGYIIFSLRPDFYEESDFQTKMNELEASSQWQFIERGEKFQFIPKYESEHDLYFDIWVYKVF